MRSRLAESRAELEAIEAERSEEVSLLLPKGWMRYVACTGSGTYYVRRAENGGTIGGEGQAHPPPETRMGTCAGGNGGGGGDGDDDDGAEEDEARSDRVKVMRGALPKGSGECVVDSLLVYMQRHEACTVEGVLEMFAGRDVSSVRIIGSGFASVTFDGEGECRVARHQAIDASGCEPRAGNPDQEWVVVSLRPSMTFFRQATDSDGISRYPVTYTRAQAPPVPAAAAPPSEAEIPEIERGSSPATSFGSPFIEHPFQEADGAVGGARKGGGGGGGLEGMTIASERGGAMGGLEGMVVGEAAGRGGEYTGHAISEADRSKKAKTKSIGGKSSGGSKSAKQNFQQWQKRRTQMEEEEEKDMGINSLEKLEEDRKRKAEEWFKSQV